MAELQKVEHILFLNLPHATRVQRRYMCSYNTPKMLFPPIELLYLAAIAREWHHLKVSLLDAIAEEASPAYVLEAIAASGAQMIVCLTGFEIFEEDIRAIREIKQQFPGHILVVFGHYPTHFPTETLQLTGADYILPGEPDINFSNLLDYYGGKISKEEIRGVYYLNEDGKAILHEGMGRIKKPDELPLPAHDLLRIGLYNEPFLPKPFGLIQSARGCPYTCNFCVRSYGTRLALRSPESIVKEIRLLVDLHKIRSFRFIDDTFTATSKRVIRFCKLLIESGMNVKWSCLSRADTLDEEMIAWMKKAGCVRVYIGVESGSPKILDTITKDIDLDQGLTNIRLLQKYGMETSAFFMVGYPGETEDDFRMSVEYAKKADFDYVIPFKFVAYPGTVFYDDHKDIVDFNLFPYVNQFRDKALNETGEERLKYFYKHYYFRPGYIGKAFKRLLSYPDETLGNLLEVIRFQMNGENKPVRKDYI